MTQPPPPGYEYASSPHSESDSSSVTQPAEDTIGSTHAAHTVSNLDQLAQVAAHAAGAGISNGDCTAADLGMCRICR